MLYDTIHSDTALVVPHGSLTLASGDVLAFGRRTGQPWTARITPSGTIVWQVVETAAGGWHAAVEQADGTIVLGGYGGLQSVALPRIARMTAGGGVVKESVVPSVGGGTVRALAIVGVDTVAIVLNREKLGLKPLSSYTVSDGFLWSPTQHKVTGALFSEGGEGHAVELYATFTEAKLDRTIYVGTREVDSKQGYDGWLVRRKGSTGAIDKSVAIGTGSIDVFYGVAQGPAGGYFATGASDFTTDSHSEAWLVALDTDMKVRFESRYSLDWRAVGNAVMLLPDGGALIVGEIATTKPGAGAQVDDGLIWRVNAYGATTRAHHLGGVGAQAFLSWTPRGEGGQIVAREGPFANSKLRTLRVDAWGYASCGDSGLCVNKPLAACATGKSACTVSTCLPTGVCTDAALGKGAACDAAKVCGGALPTSLCIPK